MLTDRVDRGGICDLIYTIVRGWRVNPISTFPTMSTTCSSYRLGVKRSCLSFCLVHFTPVTWSEGVRANRRCYFKIKLQHKIHCLFFFISYFKYVQYAPVRNQRGWNMHTQRFTLQVQSRTVVQSMLMQYLSPFHRPVFKHMFYVFCECT